MSDSKPVKGAAAAADASGNGKQAPDMGGPSPAKPATPAKRRPAKRKASGSDDGDFEPKAPKPQSSPYIGVTKYKRTGRFEAHVWNSNTTAPSASGKKGRQLHLGSFHDGERAARAYDMAALKLKGYDRANTNFSKDQYHHEPFMIENEHLPLDDFVLRLRKWAQLTPKEESAHNERAGLLPPHRLHPVHPEAMNPHHHYGGHSSGYHHSSPGMYGHPHSHQQLGPPPPLLGGEHYSSRRGADLYGSSPKAQELSSYWHAGGRPSMQSLEQGGPTASQMRAYLSAELERHQAMDEAARHQASQRYAGPPGSAGWPSSSRRLSDVDELTRAAPGGRHGSLHHSSPPQLLPHASQQGLHHQGGSDEWEGPPGWGPSAYLAAKAGDWHGLAAAGQRHSGAPPGGSGGGGGGGGEMQTARYPQLEAPPYPRPQSPDASPRLLQGGLYELGGPQDPAMYGDPAAARHPPPLSTPPPPPGNMQHAQAAAARAVKDAEHASAVAASASAAAAAAAHSAGSSDRLDVTDDAGGSES